VFVFLEAILLIITLNKYIEVPIEIIYQGRDGKITQRQIEIRSIKDNLVRAYCLTQKGPRVFRLENILAAVPAKKWSV
jgi:predicted DNA-binding transcriptional regulator YafY